MAPTHATATLLLLLALAQSDALLSTLRRTLFDAAELKEAEDFILSACKDSIPLCNKWAADGECGKNPDFMHSECQQSCQVCNVALEPSAGKPIPTISAARKPEIVRFAPSAPTAPSATCTDDPEADCSRRASLGQCDTRKGDMMLRCPQTCGVCPYWPKLSKAYDCTDRHTDCEFWAKGGECTRNKGFMLESCATSCKMCEEKRSVCDRPPSTPALVTPGDIGATFTRLLKDFPQYSPEVVSKPGQGKLGDLSPWIVTLNNFLNDTEIDAFVNTCEEQRQFSRALAGDRISPVRTSQQCWCSGNKCEDNPLTRAVARRISEITSAPVRYMEPFQVLKYEEGQFYRTHHDQNSGLFTPQGPRVYTFFMYLSTPEEGGGTRFNDLGVTVPAVKGNAVLWPSVLDSNPDRDEPFANHEALPVKKGLKYAANVWVHQYDYRTPADKGCLLTHMNTH